MPKRDAGKGRYFFPESESEPGWAIEAFGALLVTLWMIIRYLFLPIFKEVEKTVIEAVRQALPPDERRIFDAQISKVNFVQSGGGGGELEAVLMRWRFIRIQPFSMPKLPYGDPSCVLFATVKLGLEDKIFTADIIAYDGSCDFIIIRPDPYDFYKRKDFKVLDVDVEPVEIDHKGKFVKFVQ